MYIKEQKQVKKSKIAEKINFEYASERASNAFIIWQH